jgi:cyclase
MLARRIIPCLDVDRGRVVKGVKFVDLVDAGDPVEAAASYDAEGADELVFLDITASHEAGTRSSAGPPHCRQRLHPVHDRGGIRLSRRPGRADAGADKVAVNPAAVERGSDRELTEVFGASASSSQSMRRRDGEAVRDVYVGGRVLTDREAIGGAEGVERGREILLTSMDRDGHRRL